MIHIYGNPAQTEHLPHIAEFLRELVAQSTAGGIEVEKRFLERVSSHTSSSRIPAEAIGPDSPAPDLVLSIGGDGTFLATAARVHGSGVPVMGINAGHLGYLAAADISRPHELASLICRGQYSLFHRSLIRVEHPGIGTGGGMSALNEVAFLKREVASMISVSVDIDGSFLGSYRGDGLLVSTPTGSTGYNLSVGGPIISPRSHDWVISPVAPHSLSMRPLVIPDHSVLTITCGGRSSSLLLAVDGRSEPMPMGTSFTLRKDPSGIDVAYLYGHSFMRTMREKLRWG